MSTYCHECGEKLSKDDEFCPNCGKNVKEDSKKMRIKKKHIILITIIIITVIVSIFGVSESINIKKESIESVVVISNYTDVKTIERPLEDATTIKTQCQYGSLQINKNDIAYNFSEKTSATMNLIFANNGAEALYNFVFTVITDANTNPKTYSFTPINKYTISDPFYPGSFVFVKTKTSNGPYTNEIFDKLIITALCIKDGSEFSQTIDMTTAVEGSNKCPGAIMDIVSTKCTASTNELEVIITNAGQIKLQNFSLVATINGNLIVNSTPSGVTELLSGNSGIIRANMGQNGTISKIRVIAGNCPGMYVEKTNESTSIGTC